ncbi:MAG: glycosyltransferase family 2 protein [Armatimonadota bacterium]
MAEAFFWGCFLTILYVYIGYPAIIAGLAFLFPSPNNKGPVEPSVAIIVIAHNEEKTIRRKLENLLSLDYPLENRRIVVVSDASTDQTDKIIGEFSDQDVRLLRMDTQGGKPVALNRVVPTLQEEVVVFSDTRQWWNNDAIRALVSNFAEENVGAVSGELHIEGNGKIGGVEEGVGLYWKYEKFLRKREALFDSTCGTTGCIYAIRKSLFEVIPDDTFLDDFVIPMNVVRKGKRVVFDENAIAIDTPSDTPEHEMRRKIRTLAGNYQAIFRMSWLLKPWKNRLFFQLVSHKLLRLAVPFLMVAIFLLNIALLKHDFYRICFIGQVIFYFLGALPTSPKFRISGTIRAFLLLNLTALIALPVFLTGRQQVVWK